MPIKKPIYATNITYLRRKLGYTRKQAATMAGLKERTWSSYEEGRAFPHHLKLVKVCRVLGYMDVITLIEVDFTIKANINVKLDAKQAMESLEELRQKAANIYDQLVNKEV